MVVIRAPRLIIAVAATILSLSLVLLTYNMLGSDSTLLQGLFLVAAVASILSLIFLFIAPRGV